MSDYLIDGTTLQSARNFLVQYLRDAAYEGSLAEGTGANDILIKGLTLLYTIFNFDVDRAIAYLSLADAQRLKGDLGSEYDTVVDSILSNWFVTRKDGTKTTGKVRLYFTKRLDFFEIKVGASVAKVGAETLVSTQTYTLSTLDFASVVNPPGGQTEFYVDISVEGSVPSDAQLVAGDAVAVLIANIYLIRGEITSDFVAGESKESSDDFIVRTSQAITTRELITDRAINTVLLEELDAINTLYVARSGSPEQLRDVVEFDYITAHIGNKADIYVGANFEPVTEELLLLGGGVQLTEPTAVDIISVTTAEGDPLDYSLTGVTENTLGAVNSNISLGIPDTEDGTPVVVRYLTCPVLEDVHAFITSADNRVVCYDPLVKSMFPIQISGTIPVRVRLSAGETLDSIQSQVQAVLISAINDLVGPEVLTLSDLIQEIHVQVPSVIGVALPVSLSYAFTDPKTFVRREGLITDIFVLPSGISDQVSWNTIKYYTDSSILTIDVQQVS